jgi:hypothetical protein
MPRKLFQLPNTASSVTEGTLKVYKSKLNKLAAQDILTPSDILQNQDKVIDIAKKDTKNDASRMRVFLSSVFFVLHDAPLESKLKLYNCFQDYKTEEYRKYK